LLRNLPARLDDDLLARCKALADAPLRPLDPIEQTAFDKRMALLFSSLPYQRSAGEKGAEVRAAAYRLVLGKLPLPQIDWMVDRILTNPETRFLPSPPECLAVANQWPLASDAVEARRLANKLYHAELNTRTDELSHWKRRIENGLVDADDIAAMPEWMTRTLVKWGHLTRCDEAGAVTVSLPRKPSYPYWLTDIEALALAEKYGVEMKPIAAPEESTTERQDDA
jgi:hypothetical protein